MNASVTRPDLGKLRGLQRVTTADGYFLICALDHLSDFQELLAPDPRSVDFRQTVVAKARLMRSLAPQVSAFLLDAEFGLAPAIVGGALPGTVGLMASIENEDYAIPPGARRTRFREGWSAHQIKMIGADVLKLLWFFRPDATSATHQRNVVADLVAECRRLSLALVVEPIWYPLEGEDAKSTAWQARRIEGIIESAHEADALGIDMLKAEFPGDVSTPQGQEAATIACRRLDAGIHVPWVILSAGVGYELFREQVRIACTAGASGFLAGRSIWRDAVSTHAPEKRQAAVDEASRRLAELAQVTRAHGRAWRPALDDDALVAAFPSGWFESWKRPQVGSAER
jgi:tagatose 1,6-diphosphate aldolase